MKNKKIIILCIIFLLSYFNPVYAEELGNAITINSVYNDENGIVVNGNISNKPEDVTILVLDENEDISYIDQKKSNDDGNFEFRFKMKNPGNYGDYIIRVGGKNVNIPKEMTFNYLEYIPMVEKKIIDGDINVSISAYKPTITGTLECFEGRTLEMVILNTTDNTEIANEVIFSDDGVFNFMYELPNLIYPKSYDILIECKDVEKSLMKLEAEISSSIVTLSAAGNLTLGENVRMAGAMQSTNTDLLNKEFNITESESVSLTIPNLVASMECNMSFECFEKMPEEEPITECSYIVTGVENEEFKVIASVGNVSSFEEKEYKVEYNEEEIEVLNLFGFESDNCVGTGKKGNVNILSYQPGEILFKIDDIELTDKNVYSGIINIFKFKFKDNYSGETTVKISN